MWRWRTFYAYAYRPPRSGRGVSPARGGAVIGLGERATRGTSIQGGFETDQDLQETASSASKVFYKPGRWLGVGTRPISNSDNSGVAYFEAVSAR